ncbi:glucosyl transferase [Salipiger sp. CCB-MM3]|uniref:glycosyltransferase family 2 protein n=1 Tax=Salipiger sp. CCB-MM3 TaxID=1792508 RepID=UPI00080AB863|nr:glycosyltransferase family 2 protein [Salipiger sp. CCB-MM3]ANT61775.1 glucosyl transferase [Salipiger sp. CCB-MM3]
MPCASIIVPAHNAADRLEPTLRSLCAQSRPDLEIIVVDDGSTDGTADLAESLGDLRIRVLRQRTRGVSGARNSGIAAARGSYIGFCDADDLWSPTKLAEHVLQFETRPTVGLSYAGYELLDAQGTPTGMKTTPPLRGTGAARVFRRNPVGNGSTAMFRRTALRGLAFRPPQETERDWWFDETFRQCETIECWLRFALTTDWEIAGVPGVLSRCRAPANTSAARTDKHLAAWERMVGKLAALDRHFFGRHFRAARAYQYRDLGRLALANRDRSMAATLLRSALAASPSPLLEEPRATLSSCFGSLRLTLTGSSARPDTSPQTRGRSA